MNIQQILEDLESYEDRMTSFELDFIASISGCEKLTDKQEDVLIDLCSKYGVSI